MGVRNLRAICPNCAGKIHTQPKGLGHFTWANSWMLVQTGTECQHCGVALSGKVAAGNKAILAQDADKTWYEREAGIDPRASREYPVSADDLFAALAEAMENNSRSGWQPRWNRKPFKDLKLDRDGCSITAKSDFRHWQMLVEPTESGAWLQITSKRAPGAFIEYGERRRLEKKILQALSVKLH